MKKYSLTEEHKKELKPWADKWIANAMSTKPMDEQDREIMKAAIKGLYKSAGLIPPPENRIVFVPSPFVARFAGGFAAAIWYQRKNPKFKPDAASRAATSAATYDATYAATCDAADDATYAAARDATYDDKKSWFSLDIKGMTSLSFKFSLGEFGLKCAKEAWRMYQGGNFWSAWDSFLTFFRHVAKLGESHGIDYSKYDHWEKASQHGSWRIMHPEFCIVSDRPRKLVVDEQNRPHCFDGPYCEWSDGSALFAIHGIRVPMWICETKREDFTKEMILEEQNADYRRCIIQKIGIEKTIELLGAEIIDIYESKVGGRYELLEVNYDGRGKRPYLRMWNRSIDAHHIEGIAPGTKTVKEAICYRNGLKEFEEPQILT